MCDDTAYEGTVCEGAYILVSHAGDRSKICAATRSAAQDLVPSEAPGYLEGKARCLDAILQAPRPPAVTPARRDDRSARAASEVAGDCINPHGRSLSPDGKDRNNE